MTLEHAGDVLVLLIALFFLFRFGHALATGYFNNTFYAWTGAVLFLVYGWNLLIENNPFGFYGFIPIMTYIFFKITNGISWDTSTQKRAQAVIFSAGASVVVYVVTEAIFGFGVTEASIGSVIAAAVLGIVGYRT